MVEEEKLFKMMVPTAGPFSAHRNARYLMRMAKKLNADVLVVHIRDKGESREGGDEALDIFNEEARMIGMTIERIPAVGEVSQTIIELARFHEVDLIVLGATRGRSVSHWIIETIINKTDIPVILVPWNYEGSHTEPIQIEKVKV
jgi:nucleotide-binding universal stress UspA family protein